MRFALFAFGLITACGLARAQPAPPAPPPNADAALCSSTTNHPDLAIKHCTAAIASHKGTNEMLAQWYVLRGVEWSTKGDYDRAVADHTTALKLDAKVAHAHYYRATAWANKGDFERAIADFDAALQQRPNDALTHHARAIELAVKGDYARAIADFDKALQLDPKADGLHFARGRTLFYMSDFARAASDLETAFTAQPNVYTALWLFLARKRGANADAEDMLERDTRRIRGGWPSPVIALFMGRTDINSVMASTIDPNTALQRDKRCEAEFYIAHSHLLKGERARAVTLLQDLQKDCRKNLLEYEGSVAELRRTK